MGTRPARARERSLASVDVLGQSGLLGRVDRELVVALDGDPRLDVGAVVRRDRGHPLGRVLVALGLVHVVRHGWWVKAREK